MEMDWSKALQESLSWLAVASLVTIVAFSAAAALAVRFTRWGSQFWQVAGPYLSPKRSWKPLLVFTLLLVMALFSVRMNVLFSFWYNGFYSALQGLDQTAFWYFLGIFAVLAAIHVLRALFNYYLTQAFNIRWRVWLTERLTGDWMNGDAYYRGQFLDEPVDNPDQRIELDVNAFVTGSVSLALGAVSALVSLVAFTGILWGLSAPLTVGGVEIPRAMVFAVYIYVIIATWIAFRLGRPLIRLNFLNEKLTANFRYALMRLREYAENVAFYQGTAIERGTLLGRFSALIGNVWAMVYRSLKFDGFNLVVSQVAVVFPFILQAPRFFSGAIKLGDVMQTSQAFGQVQDSLSFFRTSYDTFAQYRATLDRLTGFLDANQQARELPKVDTHEAADGLRIESLDVLRPDGHRLLADLALELVPGQALLIKGPSGSGKTTLLRALAGLWPYAEGTVYRPGGHQALFLSQRPYLPLGDLRTAIAYPNTAVAEDDERLKQALRQVNLAHLAERLELSQDWTRILSIGEQQRLAFARVLFNRPRVVFLDESTSAMDEGLEHALYSLLREHLDETLLVSVGHRATLAQFHTHRLDVDGQGGWALREQAGDLA
ncbi:ABC transporter ATP-binding protein/permease [Metapseudomonas otitidis]|jgi:putative ATP-binding cassette transporter|uniref:ATP-binding cassette domain-containing protein n=1 Tax=Metapseudomonas otitidis TaxID=319939 RepID=A0A1I0ULX9_9GAMM|nr:MULTISPECIES: ABC transporter ATP-binding protein/permease [Pseudomonas]KIV75522.1 Alkanesulfonates ABC transporter ATP-binding protein [Pseudomonas sp. FeS53a]MCO7552745.1 ABC transporter ATP-binding protein/permease [Pseudomonas otitidis]MDU9396839.1 ABC transporter ATP-binding protein/permease [Pseudomonas sp. zfem003]MWK56233.1 ATP-binding cassette domain-containing protein [Pseudomonas otitidis]WIF65189.1 ABC transporter ATP-binding protein/permease [Pseudomonas otitidis]